jgi:hypothetical protein
MNVEINKERSASCCHCLNCFSDTKVAEYQIPEISKTVNLKNQGYAYRVSVSLIKEER